LGEAFLVNRSHRSVKFYAYELGDYVLRVIDTELTAIPSVDLLGPHPTPSRSDVAEQRTWLTWD
jgi:hypothetical protein